jgi:dynein heavy chain 1, cytosolic
MEGPVVSQGANGIAPTSPLPTIEPTLLIEYLVELLQITLGSSRKELESPGSFLAKSRYSESVSRCSRFAAESQVALYIAKDAISNEINGDAEGSGMFTSLLLLCSSIVQNCSCDDISDDARK